jgi:hypothetical protein
MNSARSLCVNVLDDRLPGSNPLSEGPLHLNVKSSRGQNSPLPWSVSELLEAQRPADVICQMPVSGQSIDVDSSAATSSFQGTHLKSTCFSRVPQRGVGLIRISAVATRAQNPQIASKVSVSKASELETPMTKTGSR